MDHSTYCIKPLLTWCAISISSDGNKSSALIFSPTPSIHDKVKLFSKYRYALFTSYLFDSKFFLHLCLPLLSHTSFAFIKGNCFILQCLSIGNYLIYNFLEGGVNLLQCQMHFSPIALTL